jgi:hypothetical protein
MFRVALFSVVLVLASCGREGDFTTGSTVEPPAPASSPAPTRAPVPSASSSAGADLKTDFIDGANTICRDFARRIDALGEPGALGELPGWLRGFVRVMDDLQVRFRALRSPPADAAAIDRYLDGNDDQLAALRGAIPEVDAASRTGDENRADAAMTRAFTSFDQVAAQQDPFARGYGLIDCVEPEASDTVTA